MSTDPNPEAGAGATENQPQQGGRTVEWPKKIRTLTAAELDRLTIDSAGRFYWDGTLVNYEPPQGQEPNFRSAEATEQSAMDLIDRAVQELDPHKRKAAETAEDVAQQETATAPANQNIAPAVQFEPAHRDVVQSSIMTAPITPTIAPMFTSRERVRLSLSFWQSLGALVVVFGIAMGALGVSAYGLVVAHDWTCRIGLVQRYCPPPPPPPPPRPPRPDIPA